MQESQTIRKDPCPPSSLCLFITYHGTLLQFSLLHTMALYYSIHICHVSISVVSALLYPCYTCHPQACLPSHVVALLHVPCDDALILVFLSPLRRLICSALLALAICPPSELSLLLPGH
jgi:hypothetical protein